MQSAVVATPGCNTEDLRASVSSRPDFTNALWRETNYGKQWKSTAIKASSEKCHEVVPKTEQAPERVRSGEPPYFGAFTV
jgi:hypothetical protein